MLVLYKDNNVIGYHIDIYTLIQQAKMVAYADLVSEYIMDAVDSMNRRVVNQYTLMRIYELISILDNINVGQMQILDKHVYSVGHTVFIQ